jgi:hypothetical protein
VSLLWTDTTATQRPSILALVALGILFGLGFMGLTGAIERPTWEVLTGSCGLSEAASSPERMDY